MDFYMIINLKFALFNVSNNFILNVWSYIEYRYQDIYRLE